jgi:hypothetical protein
VDAVVVSAPGAAEALSEPVAVASAASAENTVVPQEVLEPGDEL